MDVNHSKGNSVVILAIILGIIAILAIGLLIVQTYFILGIKSAPKNQNTTTNTSTTQGNTTSGEYTSSNSITLTGQLTVTGTSAVMTLNIQDSGATAIKTGAIILPSSMSAASTGGVANGCTGSGTSVTLSSAMNPGSSTTCYLTGSSSEFKAGSNYPVTITASESGGTVSQTITLTASP